VDPDRLCTALGVQLHHSSLHEFLPLLDACTPEEVRSDLSTFGKLGIALKDVEPEDLDTASRFYLAFKKIMSAEHLDALAIRCWPELPRLWSCDEEYKLTAPEGRTIAPKRHLLGNNGVVEIQGVDIMQWFGDLIHEGLPHYVMVAKGHQREKLRRFARQMEISWIGS